MPTYRFDDVRLVLAEPRMELRHALEEALVEQGFRRILATGNMLPVRQAVETGEVDLLIGDTTLPEGDLSELIFDVRHGRLGENPFLVTITLVSNPDQETVRKVINSGTDTVLLKPFTPGQMVDRIMQMVANRKKFVVTTDYIGPDRRSSPRGEGIQIPLIEVPNPLHAKVQSNFNGPRQRRSIEAAKIRINEQKVERHAYQVGWLIERIVPELPGGDDGSKVELGEEAAEHLERLVKVSEDLSRRIKGTRHAHVAGMCMSIGQLADNILKAEGGVDEEDMRLLGALPALINRAFAADDAPAQPEVARVAERKS